MNSLKMTDSWLNLTYSLTNELGIAIVNGDLVNSDSLFTMTEISKTYKVSLNVVREAMKILYAKGLLSINPKIGVTPTHPEKWNLFDPDVLKWALSSNSARSFFLELEELRIAIEPAAASLAADNYSDTVNIRKISLALDKIDASTTGSQNLLDAENDFYIAILLASKNPYFIEMCKCIKISNKLRFSLQGQSGNNYATKGILYRTIFEAINSGDKHAAFKYADQLTQQSSTVMKMLLSNDTNQTFSFF